MPAVGTIVGGGASNASAFALYTYMTPSTLCQAEGVTTQMFYASRSKINGRAAAAFGFVAGGRHAGNVRVVLCSYLPQYAGGCGMSTPKQ